MKPYAAAQAKGDSFRRQSEQSKAWAEQHGLSLVEDFRLHDIGVSAYRGDNLAFGALGTFIEEIKKKKIPKGSYLLVESLDRLSRDAINRALELFLSIINNGVSVVTLADGQIYREGERDPSKIFFSVSSLVRANEESEVKSHRLRAAWNQKRAQIQDRKLTRRCPAWLKLSAERRSFVLDAGNAKVIRDIFTDAANGVGTYLITMLKLKIKDDFPSSIDWLNIS
jgi:DNA invertase Pin-like site-specific DNA recombinase